MNTKRLLCYYTQHTTGLNGFYSIKLTIKIKVKKVCKGRHTQCFFLVAGQLRFYPSYTNGLVVHATFFFLDLQSETDFDNIFFFFPFFGLKKSDFIEKSVFLLSGQGGLPSLQSTPLVVRPLFFMCVFPIAIDIFVLANFFGHK